MSPGTRGVHMSDDPFPKPEARRINPQMQQKFETRAIVYEVQRFWEGGDNYPESCGLYFKESRAKDAVSELESISPIGYGPGKRVTSIKIVVRFVE